MNNYCLYGLTVATPFHCPELLPSSKAPEVIVCFENIDDSAIAWSGEGVCYKASPDKYLLDVKGTARYLLIDGRRISIEKDSDADEDALRLFLYNEVAAALLMQRGMLVLKGSVVARDGKAFVLLGGASVGKSMTAAGLGNKGYSIVADGVCAIGQNGSLVVAPGFPSLLLWKKGLKELDLPLNDCRPVRNGMNKFYFPVTHNFTNETLPVAGIWLLSEHNKKDTSSTAIEGADKFFAILSSCYHPELATPMGVRGGNNKLAAITAKEAKIRKMEFNMSPATFGDYIDFLGKELGR